MSITEERRARHLELRERMLQGDNGARWELAMEAVPLLIHLFMRKNRLQLRCGIEGGDLRAEAALMAYQVVPMWDPEKGTLGTFSAYYAHPLAAAMVRQSGAVSLKGRDYFQKRKVTAIRESGIRLPSGDSGTDVFERILGDAVGELEPDIATRIDASRYMSCPKLTKAEKTALTMMAHDRTPSECGRELGFSRQRANQLQQRGLAKMREMAARETARG